jgi:hypothetical protein
LQHLAGPALKIRSSGTQEYQPAKGILMAILLQPWAMHLLVSKAILLQPWAMHLLVSNS